MRTNDYRQNDTKVLHRRPGPGLRGIRFLGLARVDPSASGGWAAELRLASWTYTFTDDEWEFMLTSPTHVDLGHFPSAKGAGPSGGGPYIGSAMDAVPIWWMPGMDSDGYLTRPQAHQLALYYTAHANDWIVEEWAQNPGSLGWALQRLDGVTKAESVQVGIALPGPRKIVPALPAESNTLFPDAFKPFNAACAWKATRIAAGDPEK